MKKASALASLACLFAGSLLAHSQQLPPDTGTTAPNLGFSLPRIGGTFNYGLSASEQISHGYYNTGTFYTTNLAGDLAYLSKSERHPFSAVYAGGVLIANSNSGQPTTTYQSLSFSQVLNTRHWNITAADSVSYLPQSPTTGLSGIPGVGDLGVDPVSIDPGTGIGILTTYGPRVSNTASLSVGRQLTSRISAQGTGIFAIQRFLGDNSTLGLNTTSYGGSGGVSYRFSARDTLTGNYNYNHFAFNGGLLAFDSQGVTVEYSRQWNQRFTTDFYAGPQFLSGTQNVVSGTSTTVAAGASATFVNRRTSYSLNYFRGANNGSGVVGGAISDNVIATAHRQFGRPWLVSGSLGFNRSVTLPNFLLGSFESRGVSAGAQVSRGFGRSFFGFASYTVQQQSIPVNTLANTGLNAYAGTYQVIGLGVTYSPRGFLLGR